MTNRPGDGGHGSALGRRTFLQTTSRVGMGLLAAGMAAGPPIRAQAQTQGETTGTGRRASSPAPQTGEDISSEAIPRREFGKTGVKVSALGLGGYHIGIPKDEALAIRIIQEAIDNGITFLDNCWDYHMGVSEERMGKALQGRRDQVFLMTKVCTHGRDARVGMKQLEDSLRRLRTDRIDLWQIHEVAYHNDPRLHFAPGGVAEALLKAREQGKVRFLGFTGHKHPDLHREMLSHNFPFDAVQMPLNPFDGTFLSFEQNVLPELRRRGIAPIGMKPLGGTGDMVRQGAVTVEEALRYAMSLPVAVTVTGMESLEVLRQNLRIARGFRPMSPEEMEALRRRVAPLAADGRFELFKTSARFEGDVGREQHGFPPSKEMAL